MEFDIQIEQKMLKKIYGYSGMIKVFRVLFIVLADLFIVFSVIIIGYDSVFSPEFPVPIGAFFLILLLWLHVEMVVQYFWRGKRRSRILKKCHRQPDGV